ncbi:MAG: ABC transporter ATP-binding protein [Syntrophorhabdaceae bacterium]|nr:ABC transporter ATP-binding protein [Syntrophorhabdaceae bacterium]MDD5244554.1 ABC transporter ATP-binding protein [Syntrophorhabdaceae bacterium]
MITIRNFTYAYPEARTPALQDINLDIRDGECVLIVGPTGSGKTTLLYTLNGLIPHVLGGRTDGEIRINGFSPGELPVREISRFAGTVFQDPESQIFMLKVADEVAFGCENLLMPADEIVRRSDRALAEMGMSHLKDAETFTLSGGQKQRLVISSVYAMGPDIFLFDEPTTDIDTKGRKEFLEIVKGLKESGKTVIVVEHQHEEFSQLADRVVRLEDGKVNGRALPVPEHNTAPRREQRPPEQTVHLRLEGVCFAYKKGDPVLEDINIEIKENELIAVGGDNGSGKSTLLKIMAGLLKPASGEVRILDKTNPKVDDLVGQVGFLFQNPDEQLFTNSVEEEILFGPKQIGKTIDIERYLRLCGLESMRDRHPQTLSRGQRQLLAVISILALEPQILILDEPTTGLDRNSWSNLMDLLSSLTEQGVTVVFATHNIMAREYADRYIHLDKKSFKKGQGK